MIDWIRIFVLLACSLFITGCEQDRSTSKIVFAEPDESPSEFQVVDAPLRVAISSVLSPTETVMYYRELANYIGEQLDRPTILIQRKSYSEINNLMIKGAADIAFFPTGAYITNRDFEGIEAIAMQERMGLPYYYGYIVVHSESAIDSLIDLKGKNVAFTDPTSYSGYLFFEKHLENIGETPENFLGRYNFTYNHENTLNAVVERIVDGAAVNSFAFERAKLQKPELVNRLKIITRSEPIGTGPIVVRKNLPDEEKKIITDSFMSMHEIEHLLPSLQGLFIDRFVPFEPALYEVFDELDK
ncbi:substrate-binding domain-containing protein [Sporosarcina highlanderae]|uniref:Phosphate/phosphite/phosphonate ABC transporter substrate-binding protein n=1 Tax=Sporosarcina highlanderae TaxID=3035916 RepID=A0ABT8JSL8_9BACL|nr:phosphate/phosphite/phosphonate ABC transporter substrate-binding protein [Sporosarcina highlanderae]MDN4608148.1 phosphate/phosphite/phosphonate ABC transporter substrate-binding protein [Sporosarcina highlanderae]